MRAWRLLDWGKDVPRLLVKTRLVEHDGYEVQLTDLSRMWSEKLKHSDIVKRAANEGCSIDPSENDQYEILLHKIESAIKGDKGTSIELKNNEDEEDLVLFISADLPGSLPTFYWTIQLERQSEYQIGQELVTPLLQQAHHLRRQVQSLIDEVASRDRVIAKITDRLESSGNDLTTVFPGVSNVKTNRKRSQREQLASHVKGLADFNENEWRASVAPEVDHFEDPLGPLNDVLSDLPSPVSSTFNDKAKSAWWKSLDSGNIGSRRRHEDAQECSMSQHDTVRKPVNGHKRQSSPPEDDGVQDDEAQKRDTPPHLKHRSGSGRQSSCGKSDMSDVSGRQGHDDAAPEDESTEDEEDLDAAPSRTSSSQTKGRSQQNSSQASTNKTADKPARKLGMIGGRRSLSPAREIDQDTASEHETSPQSVKPKQRLRAIGGKAEIAPTPEPYEGAEAAREISPARSTNNKKLGAFGGKRHGLPQEDSSQPKPKSKLGAFGGPLRRSDVSDADETAEAEEGSRVEPRRRIGAFGGKSQASSQHSAMQEDNASSKTSPARRRLGAIGGRASARTSASPPMIAVAESEKHGNIPDVEATASSSKDKVQETAEQKRERLKRQLEEQSKHPVKKKRKF